MGCHALLQGVFLIQRWNLYLLHILHWQKRPLPLGLSFTHNQTNCESDALNMPRNLQNSAVATGLEKSVFIPIPKKGNAKECSSYRTIALISHTSKVMLKILQAELQQYVKCALPDVQPGFRKGRGTRDQIANICWIMEKAREFQKNIYFCFIDYAKAFDCMDHSKLWKILQEMETPDHLICLLRNL